MEFRYRYASYGTAFTGQTGERPDKDALAHQLYENEVVVDLGGAYWGYGGCEIPVLDHHFDRADGKQFPAAACGVLAAAGRLWDRFHASKVVWLVTHASPDLDAVVSMYLARTAIEAETRPEWPEERVSPEADWFHPVQSEWSEEQWWQVALASCAAYQDQCKAPPVGSRQYGLSAYLQITAKGHRQDETGWFEFCEDARREIVKGRKNPLTDSLFRGVEKYKSQTARLDEEPARYREDVKRMRTVVALVPRRPRGAAGGYQDRAKLTLLDEAGRLREEHTRVEEVVAVDGAYLRDPRSLLFKEWARDDVENSPGKEGFVFTAVARTGGRAEGQKNKSEYICSVNPEYREKLWLYPLWARLQELELKGLLADKAECERRLGKSRELDEYLKQEGKTLETAKAERSDLDQAHCRQGYEDRADGERHLWGDPWFDGVNFDCTLVAAPGRGTWIEGEGRGAELDDDEIGRLVRDEIENGHYLEPPRVEDVAVRPGGAGGLAAEPRPVAEGCARLAVVRLREGVKLEHPGLAEQTGRDLWQVLMGRKQALPNDFAEWHLVKSREWVAVWHRTAGIALAYQGTEGTMGERFRQMAALMVELHEERGQTADDPKAGVRRADELARRVAEFRGSLNEQGLLPLKRYFEATATESELAALTARRNLAYDRLQMQENTAMLNLLRDAQKQSEEARGAVEVVEVLVVALYGMEVVHLCGELLAAGSVVMARVVSGVGVLLAGAGYAAFVHTKRKLPRVFSLIVAAVLVANLGAAVFFAEEVRGWLHHKSETQVVLEEMRDEIKELRKTSQAQKAAEAPAPAPEPLKPQAGKKRGRKK